MGGSAQQIADGNSGYHGLRGASNNQAILVAPEGQDFQDDGLGWGNANGEDIAFYHAMRDRFGAQLCIDQNRIFSTGFSFGAMFSFTLACSAGQHVASDRASGRQRDDQRPLRNGTRSVPTMAFIGVDDSLLSGHRSAVQIFVQRNGCSTQTTTVQPSWCDGLASSYLPCTCVQYQNCKAGYPVISCEYKAGHHPRAERRPHALELLLAVLIRAGRRQGRGRAAAGGAAQRSGARVRGVASVARYRAISSILVT